MNINFSVIPALLIIFLLLNPLHAAQADDDHIEARHLLDAGKILALESILKNVRDRFPGKILEVKLEREEHEIVYEIEVLGDDNVVREVNIDARTGKVLSSKEDD